MHVQKCGAKGMGARNKDPLFFVFFCFVLAAVVVCC